MKRSLSHGAKKEYVKPEITRNEPLVDITFATVTATSAASAAAGTLTGVGGGSISGLITQPKVGPGSLGTGGGGSGLGEEIGGGSLTGGGSLLPGTGGAPGTVL